MLVLASQSPRRADILRQAGIPFTVRAAPVDEAPLPGEDPKEYVQRLAERKARAVPCEPTEIVLGADTTVVIDGEMLAKPEDAADARRMLAKLSGRRHEVMTGICLRWGSGMIRDGAITSVWFMHMSQGEIAEYVSSGETMDKAGAYAIQGLAGKYVEQIEGCYFNVMGLPVNLVYRSLRELAALQNLSVTFEADEWRFLVTVLRAATSMLHTLMAVQHYTPDSIELPITADAVANVTVMADRIEQQTFSAVNRKVN